MKDRIEESQMSNRSGKSTIQSRIGKTLNVRCNCGDICKIRISRKPVSYGREFVGCPNFQVRSCGFFRWVDELEEEFWTGNSQVFYTEQKSKNLTCQCGEDMLKNRLSETEQRHIKAIIDVIAGLLTAILIMLTVIVIKM